MPYYNHRREASYSLHNPLITMTNTYRFAITYKGLETEKPAYVTWVAQSSLTAVDYIMEDEDVSTVRLMSINGTML